jgi:hypothetical protein
MSAEACRPQILARLDQTKSDMDRYYHAFLQLEHVVSQVVANQAELARSIAALQARAPAAALQAPAPPAAAREGRWRGVPCAHGQRRYRCRHADCVAARAARAARAAQRAQQGPERAQPA